MTLCLMLQPRSMSGFCIFCWPHLGLTDYDEGKPIAQLPQVRHQVHQNQKLKETQTAAAHSQFTWSEQILCITFRRTGKSERCQTPNKAVGVSRYVPRWTLLGRDMGHPHPRRKGMWLARRTRLAVCHVT